MRSLSRIIGSRSSHRCGSLVENPPKLHTELCLNGFTWGQNSLRNALSAYLLHNIPFSVFVLNKPPAANEITCDLIPYDYYTCNNNFFLQLIVPVWAEWITVPRHLKENHDYTGLEYIAKVCTQITFAYFFLLHTVCMWALLQRLANVHVHESVLIVPARRTCSVYCLSMMLLQRDRQVPVCRYRANVH